MPKVGKKHFAYTPAGEAAAAAEASATGEKVEKGYSTGGRVKGARKKKKKKKSSTKAPKGYVVARGSGAARPQYFKVNT